MRLIYVCTDFGIQPRGVKGASIHLRSITQALADAGCEVRLLNPHEAPNGGHPAVGLLDHGTQPDHRAAKALRRWLEDRDYAIGVAGELRALCYNESVLNTALLAAKAWKPTAILERLSLFGHVGLDLAQAFNVPLVVEVNAILSEEASRFRALELNGLAEEIERRVLLSADAVIAVSAPLAERLAAMGVERGRIHVAPNGVDARAFEDLPDSQGCRAGLGVNGAFVVGFCGSLKPWHGVDVLLDAFARLHRDDPACRLLVVGEGPMADTLKASANELGVKESVVFTGGVSHDQVPRFLRAMDVAVAPFNRMDDFYFSPIKVFEYMAAGACTVASRMGQLTEVIQDGVNGLLVEPDDPAALYESMRRLRSDANERARLATRGRDDILQQYTWRRTAEKTIDIIRQAAADHPQDRRARIPAAVLDCIQDDSADVRAQPVVRPPRVGYLLRMYPRFSQTFVVEEILELERQGADLRIASLRKPMEGVFHESISRVRARADYLAGTHLSDANKFLPVHWRLLRQRPAEFTRAIRCVASRPGAEWTDLVQAGLLLRWAEKHHIDHVHVHFGTNEATVALLAHQLGGLSYSMTVHAFDIFRQDVDRPLLAAKINASRFTVTVSEYNRRFLTTRIPGVNPDKVRVNYNGVDLEGFSPTSGPRQPGLIFAAGRLIEKKGFIHLIRAVALLRETGRDVQCRIAGEGREFDTLKAEIKKHRLKPYVQLIGSLEHGRIIEQMRLASCFALPCVEATNGDVDALPTVLLEAMAVGCPAISTSISGVPEIIEDGVSGLLVPPESPAALADALYCVLSDANLAARLTDGGISRVQERFDIKRNVATMKQWLDAAASGRDLGEACAPPEPERSLPSPVPLVARAS